MKTLILIFVYLGSFALLFFTFSAFGLLWASWSEVLGSTNWFIGYALLIGWWVSVLPAAEYYAANKDYFQKFI